MSTVVVCSLTMGEAEQSNYSGIILAVIDPGRRCGKMLVLMPPIPQRVELRRILEITMRRKSFCYITISIFLVLSMTIFPRETHAEPEAMRGLNLSKENGGKIYAIVFGDVGKSGSREGYATVNPDHKLPALLLFHEGQGRRRSSPRMYVAIWEDGLIVWGAGKGSVLVANDIENHELEIKYFRVRVDPDKIKKMLVALANSSIWENPVPLVIANPTPPATNLIIRSEGKRYTYTAPRIDASAIRHIGRGEYTRAAVEWEKVTKTIFDVIPKEGNPVSISFREYGASDQPLFGWVGIVE